jgi:hypothetical protein
MDDIIIGGANDEEMLKNLKIVMKRLADHNLKIRLLKTHFWVKEVKVLGVIFSATGKKVDPAKVKAINEFGPLDSLKKAQTFLGMLAFISSFIPNFSTACYPIYALLKNQKSQKFCLTKEAVEAYESIKNFLKKETMQYHPDFSKPMYLSTDASQVGAGGFLYQVESYTKDLKGQNELLEKLGFVPEPNKTHFLLPGISPGKNTPVVKDFLKNAEDLEKYDVFETLKENETMTEKIAKISDKVFVVRPIAFFSRCFTQGQVLKYSTMEKEFAALMLSLNHFRDYVEAAPITYVLSDSQPVLWALKHKESNVKLARWLLKLFELNISIVLTHVAGTKNAIADYLSRLYYVNEPATKDKEKIGPKDAQHITPLFSPLQVVTKEQIVEAFAKDTVSPCSMPTFCHLNVNNYLLKNLGPFEPVFTCLDAEKPVVNKLLESQNFCLTPEALQKHLTLENILNEQKNDKKLSELMARLDKGEQVGNYFLQKNILCKHFLADVHPSVIVLPECLVPFCIAMFHFKTHAGFKKLLATIKLQYFWKNMYEDVKSFCRGCILCSIFKHSTTGKTEVGTPRAVLRPNSHWQIDICSGLPSVKGQSSFLNMVEMYSGYCVPVVLKGETSEDIAKAVEHYLIKPFGAPEEISADNASNLNGPPMKKLLKFYNIRFRQTVAYSPESHSNVEISNRYVVELIRLFADQFQVTWPNVVTIAALVQNTVPRPQLMGHSPHYLMFLQEPFGKNLFFPSDEENLDINTYVKKSTNDKNFVKLVREFLLKKRITNNAEKNKKFQSFPKGTVVYVKDMRPMPHKKFKPVFYKLPELVISEYRCTVYTNDFLGRTRKHSKNNLKIASDRTVRLFECLPTDIKLILGEEFGPDKWLEIKDSGNVPLYLQNIEFEEEIQRITRSTIPADTHLVDPIPVDSQGSEDPPDVPAEEDNVDDLLQENLMSQIKNLHDHNVLVDPTISLHDVPALHDRLLNSVQDTIVPIPQEEESHDTHPLLDPAGINIDNILPIGSRRHRNVRFNI